MTRRNISFFLFIILCLLFFSCEKKAAETKGIILGFSQIGAESAWRNCNTRSVQEAAAEAGIQLLFFNAEQKQENQIKAIRSFIAYQVDVIAFVPIVTDGWENVLEEAKEAGIPVLVCDREINIQDESLYAGYLGTNMLVQGRSSAEFLIKKYINPDTGKFFTRRNQPVRIVELRGTEGSSPAIMRARGFREALAEYPEFEIIYSESGDFLRSKGYELMCNILEDNIVFDVLYSHNDGMTLGAIEAMKERGIKTDEDIVIVSIDAEQAAINALIRGDINCVVECNPKQGPEIIRLSQLLAKGETIPRMIFMIEEVFTEWDDVLNIGTRGY
ncbi:MAG: ABC transporter substrate-binding protein [Treponema sp.]|nr:ABC transporter substrate-binding protein [Treponema sp.]MCL2271774.1 ABC transporter substrate-binding protein [Treponema sp.]